MTLLIVSDSHGRCDRLERLLELHKNADALIFLGDGLSDLDRAGVANYSMTVFSVKGNCDGFLSLRAMSSSEELTFNLGGISFFVLHGHTRGVKSTLSSAICAAGERGADALLFGHTHKPFGTYISQDEYNLSKPLYAFNPGSLSEYSYGLCEIRNRQFLFSHGSVY